MKRKCRGDSGIVSYCLPMFFNSLDTAIDKLIPDTAILLGLGLTEDLGLWMTVGCLSSLRLLMALWGRDKGTDDEPEQFSGRGKQNAILQRLGQAECKVCISHIVNSLLIVKYASQLKRISTIRVLNKNLTKNELIYQFWLSIVVHSKCQVSIENLNAMQRDVKRLKSLSGSFREFHKVS
jgi:hypothetical protein